MKATGTIIKSNGDKFNFYSALSSPSLKELQKIVGGYFEFIFLADGNVMVVNEEGIMLNLPHNIKASEMLFDDKKHDSIRGDVLIIKSEFIK